MLLLIHHLVIPNVLTDNSSSSNTSSDDSSSNESSSSESTSSVYKQFIAVAEQKNYGRKLSYLNQVETLMRLMDNIMVLGQTNQSWGYGSVETQTKA